MIKQLLVLILATGVWPHAQTMENLPKSLSDKLKATSINNRDNEKSLIDAISLNQKKFVNLLLAGGVNPNTQESIDDYASYALILAARLNRKSILKTLLAYKAHINAQDTYGMTSLMYAVELGNLALVMLLLKRGAQVDLFNYSHESALRIAFIQFYKKIHTAQETLNFFSIITLLLDKVTIDNQDMQGRTDLLYVTKRNLPKAVDLLISKKANREIQDKKGRTALMVAKKKKYVTIIELLE